MRRSTPRWRWSMPGSRSTARKPPPRPIRLDDLDVLPEAESAADCLHVRTRRLVGPGGARVPLAADDDVVELHAVRTFQVIRGFSGLFQPIQAHRGGRKVLVAL